MHLYKRMALFRRINDRHTYFGVDAVGNSIFVFDSALYFDSHGCGKFFFNVFILNQGKKFGGDKDYIVFNLTFYWN